MKNRNSIILIIVFAVVFLVTSVLFNVFGITDIWSQLTGTLLGTIITAIVTVLLLGVQTNKEISHDRDVGVFEKKQEVYHQFIEALESITQDGKVNIPNSDNEDKNDELQHLIYQLGFVQMHANHDVAEEITDSVGGLLSTISLMQNGASTKKNELYSQFAENVFGIVSLLRNDLYNSNFNAVSKEKFNSALRATGAFDDELLSENGRVGTLIAFLTNLKSEFEKKKYSVEILYRSQPMEIKQAAQRYVWYKTNRWLQVRIHAREMEKSYLFFNLPPEGGLWHGFFSNPEPKAEFSDKVFSDIYFALKPKDMGIDFLNTKDPCYRMFARLAENEQKVFVEKMVKTIDEKIKMTEDILREKDDSQES